MNFWSMLRTRRELIANLVSRHLKTKYKGSALGVLWSLLTPLFMAVIYVFFLRLLARGVPMEQIIIGVFAWQFTVLSVQDGLTAVTGNANLVKKVFFPRLILPLSTTLADLVNYLLSLVVQLPLVMLLLALRPGDAGLSVWACWLPALILYQFLFNLALAWLLAAANVYFRDTQHLVGVLLSAWFFISPVMYNLDLVRQFTVTRPWIIKLYMLNPLACVIEGYRAALLKDVSFPWHAGSVAGLLWPLLLLPIAYALYNRAQRNFADLL